MDSSVEKIIVQRKLYQSIMSTAFALETVPKYLYLQSILYLGAWDWFISLIIAPVYIIWKYYNDLSTSTVLELIQYTLAGVLYSLISIVLIFKKKEIISNYSFIQFDFVQWSNKRRTNPNKIYENFTRIVNDLLLPMLVITGFISFGPLLAAINDLGSLPLDDRSHLPLYLPKFFDINNFGTYGCMYLIQSTICIILYISVGAYTFAFLVFLLEISNQFELLLDGLEEAFNFRFNQEFQTHFIDCVRHHQLIIRFLDDFKSYFKWIILVEIIILQGIFATALYNLIKGDAPVGYKAKIVGIVMFNLCLFVFHCHIGEVIQSMHKRLADKMYFMTWYDMPVKHKQLIVIMFQRTRRDLSLSSAVFSSEIASRQLITKVIRQAYTLLNVLLKT